MPLRVFRLLAGVANVLLMRCSCVAYLSANSTKTVPLRVFRLLAGTVLVLVLVIIIGIRYYLVIPE